MSKRIEQCIARLKIEEQQNWRDEIGHVPFIQFPADWHVQVIPPFHDAVVRFRVKLPNGDVKSIYLDRRNTLGYWEYDEPYWEVYPYRRDVGRCGMQEIDELLRMIADTEERDE